MNNIQSNKTYCIYCKRPLVNKKLSQKQSHYDCEKSIQKWIKENKDNKIFITESNPEAYMVYFRAPYCEIITSEEYEKLSKFSNRIYYFARYFYCQFINDFQIKIRKNKKITFRTVF